MASITLSELWLHNGADLADYVTSQGFASQSSDRSARGEVRTYAGGRQRIIRRAGTPDRITVTLPSVSRAVVTWLEDHAGQLCLLRDPRGRKIWGTFWTVSVSEKAGSALPDVSLELQSVTHSEAV